MMMLRSLNMGCVALAHQFSIPVSSSSSSSSSSKLLLVVPKVHRRWGFRAHALARDFSTTTGLLVSFISELVH